MNLKTLGLISKDLQISGSRSQCVRKSKWGLSMNRGFVLDWFVFEDEDEHEDESVHGPKAFEKTKAGSP
jgi:hypothetical protein